MLFSFCHPEEGVLSFCHPEEGHRPDVRILLFIIPAGRFLSGRFPRFVALRSE